MRSIHKVDDSLKTEFSTNGKYSTKLLNLKTQSEILIETENKILNKNEFYAVFDHATCFDGHVLLKEVEGRPLQWRYSVKNYISVWSNKSCTLKPYNFFSSFKEIKEINLKNLEKHNFFQIIKKGDIWIYFGLPSQAIKVDVSKNLCKEKLCSAKKNMPVIEVLNLDSVMFDDRGKLYFSSPEL